MTPNYPYPTTPTKKPGSTFKMIAGGLLILFSVIYILYRINMHASISDFIYFVLITDIIYPVSFIIMAIAFFMNSNKVMIVGCAAHVLCRFIWLIQTKQDYHDSIHTANLLHYFVYVICMHILNILPYIALALICLATMKPSLKQYTKKLWFVPGAITILLETVKFIFVHNSYSIWNLYIYSNYLDGILSTILVAALLIGAKGIADEATAEENEQSPSDTPFAANPYIPVKADFNQFGANAQYNNQYNANPVFSAQAQFNRYGTGNAQFGAQIQYNPYPNNQFDNSMEAFSAPLTEADMTSNELEKYKQMLDNGLISEEDYEAKKRQILGI